MNQQRFVNAYKNFNFLIQYQGYIPLTLDHIAPENKCTMEHLQLFHTSKYKLEIKDSLIPNSGKGVFTKEHIPQGSMVDILYGNIYPNKSVCFPNYDLKINDSLIIHVAGTNGIRSYGAMINDNAYDQFSKNTEILTSIVIAFFVYMKVLAIIIVLSKQ